MIYPILNMKIKEKSERLAKLDNIKDIDTLKSWYKEELFRKDRIIDNLRKENELIYRTALKQSQRLKEFQDSLDKFRQEKSRPGKDSKKED